MTEFLFCLLHYYPIGRAKLRQIFTNLLTAKNCACVKTPALATLSNSNPVSGETPSPYGRECPCRGHISSFEGDPRSPFYQSTNPEVTHEQS